METNYPWEGKVKLIIDPVKKEKFKVYIRIPGWSNSQPAPGNTYVPKVIVVSTGNNVFINRKQVPFANANGYIVIDREWQKGDVLDFEFPMSVQPIGAIVDVKQDSNRIAIQRGPIVYCVEGADNNGKAWNVIIPENTKFEVIDYKVQDEPVKALTAEVPVVTVGKDSMSLKTEKKKIIAIPYYTWANRGRNEMQVWLPTKITDVKLNY